MPPLHKQFGYLPERDEVARRLHAAMNYGRLSREQIADIFAVSVRTVDRYTAGLADPYPPGLWIVTREAGLPDAWWYADFDRLAAIATYRRQPVKEVSSLESAQRMRGALEKDRQRDGQSPAEQPETDSSTPNQRGDG